MDDEQRYWRDIWMETRAKILDNGNANLRDLKNVRDNEMILDIGPKTIKIISRIID